MADQLANNLDQAARLITETLSAAKAELDALDQRRPQLVALIARTEAMSEALATDGSTRRQMTLHEAIAFLIRENGNRWTPIKDIGLAINSRGLYHKKDGTPVEINQIHARVNNYEYLFEKNGPRVRLRVAD
jgi:hypothetical protein